MNIGSGAQLLPTGLETLEYWSQIVIVVDAAMEMDLRTELSAAGLPTHLAISIYPMVPEKTFMSSDEEEAISQKADHLMTDAVFFISRTVSDASQWYIWWLRCCDTRVTVGQLRPTAYIHCVTSHVSVEQFKDAYSRRPGADVIENDQLGLRTFRHLTICAGTSVTPLVDIKSVIRITPETRKSFNTAWSPNQARRIREAYMEHLRAGKHTMFRVIPAFSWSRFHRDKKRSVMHLLFASNQHRLSDPDFAQVLTSYLGLNDKIVAVPGRSFRSNDQSRWRRSEAIGREAQQYLRQKLQVMMPPIDSLTGSIGRRIISDVVQGLLSWERVTKGSAGTRASIQDRHISNLVKYSSFLRTQEYGAMCLVCLTRPWQLPLQCGSHGICYQCRNPLRKSHGRMCFVCDSLEHKLRLGTGQGCGRGRVLALDGGGVRGHIQLEVLALLEREIGLDLPLRYFFDLIVGTSIGE